MNIKNNFCFLVWFYVCIVSSLLFKAKTIYVSCMFQFQCTYWRLVLFFILEEYNLWANDLVDYILSCLFVCYFYYINTIGFGGFYLLSFFFLYFFVFIL